MRESIFPRKSYPAFDPSLTFTVDGKVCRYMRTPLDETYEVEPDEHFAEGSLPPQEVEVRDAIVFVMVAIRRMSALEYFWAAFVSRTTAYKVYELGLRHFEQLPSCSPEHRAAYLRMSKCSNLQKELRSKLKLALARCDRGRITIEA